jgi:SAM-dependent methyltransferase
VNQFDKSDNNQVPFDVIDITRNCYDQLASYYWARTRPELRKHYLGLLSSIERGARVLDAGCGTGYDALHLAQLGLRVVAVDISTQMCRLARQRLAIVSNVTVVEGDSCALDEPDGAFSAVLSALEIFHHSDIAATVQEYARLLAASGKLIIVTNHPVRNMLFRKPPDYFVEEFFWEDWGSHGLVPKFHWCLQTYIAAIVDAGLRLDYLHEVRPPRDVSEVQDSCISFDGCYPSFAILGCSK